MGLVVWGLGDGSCSGYASMRVYVDDGGLVMAAVGVEGEEKTEEEGKTEARKYKGSWASIVGQGGSGGGGVAAYGRNEAGGIEIAVLLAEVRKKCRIPVRERPI